MKTDIDEEVSVVMYFSARRRLARPFTISWRGQEYAVGKIGYHHTVKDGSCLHHIFEVVDKQESIWFRLNFNTRNLHWRLEAISDGLAT